MKALKKLRKSRNMTQKELADALGVTISAIGMWEVGLRTPRPEIAKKIADFFGVTMEEVYFGEVPENE